MLPNLGIHIIQYPTGRWGFVGSRIPMALCYTRADGSPLTPEDRKTIAQCGPGFCQGIKAVSFATKADAEKALAAEKGA